MPEMERKAIWGLMVGQEGKTNIPVYNSLNDRGFDSSTMMLQSYGNGWQSANFLPQERQLFGAPGGIITDWDLKTNIEGIYAAGDQLYASDCFGAACATRYYAGRKASEAAINAEIYDYDTTTVENEKKRLYAPLFVEDGYDWREINMAISKAMQNYCGGIKCDDLLLEGLDLLTYYEETYIPQIQCKNPHELMRAHEVSDILEVAKIIIQACLARKSSSKPLCFERSDYPEMDPEEDRRFITIREEDNETIVESTPLDYFGKLKVEYEKHNQDYINEQASDPIAYSKKYQNVVTNAKPTTFQEASGIEAEFELEKIGASVMPIHFNSELCVGCNKCVNVCQCNVLMPNEEKGKTPQVNYPGECWYCGSCVMECPIKGAISLRHPIMNQTKFVKTKTSD